MNPYNVAGFFCDDLREEKGSKVTVVGIYADNVNVTKIPGAFPKICVYVRVHVRPDFEVHEMILKLKMTNGEEVFLGDFDIPQFNEARERARKSDAPFVSVIMSAIASPVPVETDGRILAILRLNGEETVAAALRVRETPVATSATASAPPSEQSQPVAPAS